MDLPDSASISSNGSIEVSSLLSHGRVPELLVSLTYKPKIAQFLVKIIKAENLFHPNMANLPGTRSVLFCLPNLMTITTSTTTILPWIVITVI